jgi:predicted nucleic acid-binding protein
VNSAPAPRSRTTALSPEPRLVYADSSALIKLVIDEPESLALGRYLGDSPSLVTSQIALVEVSRAVRIANPAPEVQSEARRLLESCMLVEMSDGLLRRAGEFASASVRTLDALHLASALLVEADELVGYDRRLAAACADRGMPTSSPGAP